MATRKPKVYPKDTASSIKNEFKSLAANPKGLELKELVALAKSEIKAAIEAGYSWEEAAGVFKKFGVSIKPATLKTYLNQSSPKKREIVPEEADKPDALAVEPLQSKP